MYAQVWYGAIMNLYNNLPTYLLYIYKFIYKHTYVHTYLPTYSTNYFHGEHPLLKSFMPQLVTKFQAF